MKKLFLFLLLASTTHAQCVTSGSVITCPDTGNADTNGQYLTDALGWQYASKGAFNCGDTFVLIAGASYNTSWFNGTSIVHGPFQLWYQPGCTTYTQIISSKLALLSRTVRPTKADLPNMPRIVAVSGDNAAMATGLKANYWALRGIAITTDPATTSQAGKYVGSIFGTQINISADTTADMIGNGLILDTCYIAPGEEIAYGSIEDWHRSANPPADVNTENRYYRSMSQGVQIEMNNTKIINTTIEGIGGMDPRAANSPRLTVTSCTNASPAICTATGVASTFGINNTTVNSHGRTNATACASGPSYECVFDTVSGNDGFGGGAVMAIFTGATGNWVDLVGPMLVVYNDANTVRVYKGYNNTLSYGPMDARTPFDGSGKSTLAGTVTMRRAFNINPNFGLGSITGVDNLQAENMSVDGWGMVVFTGGFYTGVKNRATVQAGSAWNSLILDNVYNLKVGMMIEFNSSFVTANNCLVFASSAMGCTGSTARVGIVTAINGLTVSITGTSAGIIATESARSTPVVGDFARWAGTNANRWFFNGVTLNRSASAWAGKGLFECKDCSNSLFAGMQLLDGPSSAFTTVHDQTLGPWQNAGNTEFYGNLAHGSVGCRSISGIVNGVDTERSTVQSWDYRVRHNLCTQAAITDIANGWSQTTILSGFLGIPNARFSHNTFLTQDSPTAYLLMQGSNVCQVIRTVDAASTYGDTVAYVYDNIYGAGDGIQPYCWSNFPSGFTNNVMLVDGALSGATINSTIPGNLPVANKAAIGMVGTCNAANVITNCKLSSSSTYYGAASDGGDIGADVDIVNDMINRWSWQSELIDRDPSLAKIVLKAGNWQVGSTRAAVRFKLIPASISSCTVELFTTRNRSTGHADTASSNNLCSRASSITSNAGEVTFVFGAVSALTASTQYFYRITVGTWVMVGEFKTGVATGVSWTLPISRYDIVAARLFVQTSASPAMSSPTAYGPEIFSGNKATSLFTAAPGVTYYRWQDTDSSNVVLSQGPVSVRIVP